MEKGLQNQWEGNSMIPVVVVTWVVGLHVDCGMGRMLGMVFRISLCLLHTYQETTPFF